MSNLHYAYLTNTFYITDESMIIQHLPSTVLIFHEPCYANQLSQKEGIRTLHVEPTKRSNSHQPVQQSLPFTHQPADERLYSGEFHNAASKSRMCPIRRLLSLLAKDPFLPQYHVIVGTSRVSRVIVSENLRVSRRGRSKEEVSANVNLRAS